ncbi:hypothetical protein PIB30_050072 [Stylosanthes scabra]|uniref:Zinc finger PHD-type domain-containing protein n=1 Tax=Stylosanthes scabra TaxID=79078 RepID=A0ABU6UIZ8_9FABA|nr:hypothetical protein [Stylosanthes scabra]
MQKSRQSQPVDPKDIIDLTGDEERVCDTCGDVGVERFLALCNKCNDGAEHIYCMRVKMEELPKDGWTCEECMSREWTGKLVQDKVEQPVATNRSKRRSENPIDPESSKSSKLKFRSSYSAKSGTTKPRLELKRFDFPSEVQSLEKASATMTNVVPHIFSGPCDDYPLDKDFSYKKFGKVKMKSINEIMHFPSQNSSNSQEKAMVPHDYGEKRNVLSLRDVLRMKRRALEKTKQSSKLSSSRDRSPSSRNHRLKNSNTNLEGVIIDTSCKQSSRDTKEKATSSNCSIDESPNLLLQTETTSDECSLLESRSSKLESEPATKDACLEKHTGSLLESRSSNLESEPATKDSCLEKHTGSLLETRSSNLESEPATKDACLEKHTVDKYPALHDDGKGKDHIIGDTSMPFNSVVSRKSNDTCSSVPVNCLELPNPAMCLQASSSVAANRSEMEISSDENLLSGTVSFNLDVGQSCGQFNTRLQPSNHDTHEDSNTPNEKNNESQQAEQFTEGATAQIIHELCPGHALDERSCLKDFGVTISSQVFVCPKIEPSWQGKFLLQRIEEISTICDGIQAHLSTSASPEVFDVVDRLPNMIVLDELPRLTTWPAQFTEGQPTEDNIALYFFAEDHRSYRTCYKQLVDIMIEDDLALKANLDGVELLIFPSNILPEKSQRWNDISFLWGIFKGRKENNSASTQLGNKDGVETVTFNVNDNPENGDHMARVDEIPEPDRTSGDTGLLSGDSSNDNGINERVDHEVLDLTLSLSLGPKDDYDCGPTTALIHASPAAADSLDLQAANALVHLSNANQK